MVILEESFYIEAHESDVAALYRSAAPIVFSAAGTPELTTQAYLCTLKSDNVCRTCVAIYIREFKRSLIYSMVPDDSGSQGSAEAQTEAFRFLDVLGFRMEPVNLRYSPALREVVLREIPALLPPETARTLLLEKAAALADLEQLVAEESAADRTPEPEAFLNADEQFRHKQGKLERAAAVKAATRKLASEKRIGIQTEAFRRTLDTYVDRVNAPKLAAVEQAEDDRLRQQRAAAEKQAADTKSTLQKLRSDLDAARNEREQSATRLTALSLSLEHSEQERQVLAGKAQEATAALEAISRQLQQAEQLLAGSQAAAAAERAEKEQLASEKKASAQQLSALQEALERAESELRRQSDEVSRLETAQGVATTRIQDLGAERDQARADAAVERTERERLARQAADAEDRLKDLEEALQAERESTGEQVLDLVEEAESPLLSQVQNLEEQLRKALDDLETERNEREKSDRLAADAENRIARLRRQQEEQQEQEREGQLSGDALQALQLRLTELETGLQQAEERAVFYRQEMTRLEEARARAEYRAKDLERLLSERNEIQSQPAAVQRLLPGGPGNAPALSGTDTRLPQPPRRPPPPGAVFHVDWDLEKVVCSSPHEFCEIRQSINMVQLCVEGYPSQYCSAHILVLKQGETKKIYIPFRLPTSGRVLVYVPMRQPAGQQEFVKTMKEAEKFLKVAGMEIERIPIPRRRENLLRELEGVVTLLESPAQQAQNF